MRVDVVAPPRGVDTKASLVARRPEIVCLTSLRCVAALEVVLFHTLFEMGGKSAQALPTVVTTLLTRGGAAVSFFFVLSGFILAYTYGDDSGIRGTPRRFWRARFARIYPLYFLGFLLDAPRVISFFMASTASFAVAVGKIVVSGSAYLTLLQSWHPRVTNTWNTPAWSLSTEALFYAVFPGLQLVTRRWSFRRLFTVAFAAWASTLLAYVVFTQSHCVDPSSPMFQTFWRSFPPLRLPEFALGVASGRLFLSGWATGRKPLVRWLGIAAIALLVPLSASSGTVPGAVEVTLLAPLFAIAILALSSGAIPALGWLNHPTLALLGRASYAVYILHQPLKTLFMAVARRAGLASPSPGLLITYLVFVELSCVGLFLCFEDPLRRLLTRQKPIG